MAPTIKVLILKNGTIETTVEGIAGASCKDATAWINEVGTVVSEKPTDDFWKPDYQGISPDVQASE